MMTREEMMEMMDKALVEVMTEHGCEDWWEVVDGDLVDELEDKVSAIFSRDACDMEVYQDWFADMVADL